MLNACACEHSTFIQTPEYNWQQKKNAHSKQKWKKNSEFFQIILCTLICFFRHYNSKIDIEKGKSETNKQQLTEYNEYRIRIFHWPIYNYLFASVTIRSHIIHSFVREIFVSPGNVHSNNLYCKFFRALRSNLIHFVTSTLHNKLKGE